MSNPFGKTPQTNFTPNGIVNPTGTSISSSGLVTQSPDLQANLAGLQGGFANEAQAFGNLASTIQPGFSQLRQAGTAAINNAYGAQQSTLKNNLVTRGLSGSSFGNASLSNLTSQQAQDQANFQASSYINELQQNYNLIQAQYTATTNQYASAINQSNIDSALAAQLTSSNNQIAAQIAMANTQLQAQSQAGTGKLIGTALAIGAAPFTGGASLAAIGPLNGVGNTFGGGGGFGGGSNFGGISPSIFNFSALFGRNYTGQQQ